MIRSCASCLVRNKKTDDSEAMHVAAARSFGSCCFSSMKLISKRIMGCVAYVDPFEADDEGDDQSLAIHIEGYELETGKHLNGHSRVDRERFKADGDALVANMLRKMKLEPTGKTKGDQMQLPFRLVV